MKRFVNVEIDCGFCWRVVGFIFRLAVFFFAGARDFIYFIFRFFLEFFRVNFFSVNFRFLNKRFLVGGF